MERNPPHGRQSLLELIVQILDPPRTLGLVKVEGLIKRPPVFKGMETSRSHRDGEGSGRGGMTLIHMSYASESKVGMMAWASGQARECPHTNPVPRTEHPLVRPGDQKIAAHLAQTEILHPQGVNSIDAQDDPVLLGSRRIESLNGPSHFGNGELQPRAGMHPGDRTILVRGRTALTSVSTRLSCDSAKLHIAGYDAAWRPCVRP